MIGWMGIVETSDQTVALTPPSGTKATGTWTFYVSDQYNDSNSNHNKGRIDSWNITITYTLPKAGDIIGADPDSFTGSPQTVTVTVKNLGRDDANLIVDCTSWPTGWSVSPTSKQTIVPYNTTNSTYFTFTVTPPSSTDSSGTIVWKLSWDETWPTENTLLDTYNQSVTNTVPETITKPTTPSGPSSGLTGDSLFV